MPLPFDPGIPGLDELPFEEIRRRLLQCIGGRRRTPAAVLKQLTAELHLSRGPIRAAIRELLAQGELVYTFEDGHSFLEPSFDRPVRVGQRIVLCPPGPRVASQPEDIVLIIRSGAAFGAGRHPSTRLALQGIETMLASERTLAGSGSRVLDIGTGTGVLVMAAVKLGFEAGLGIDLDPCAIAEARENVRRNGLAEAIAITDDIVERIPAGMFTLIAANLRLPTLLRLAPAIAASCRPLAVLVLSGIRVEESRPLLREYERLGFEPAWRASEDAWHAVALTKRR
jgi:ribosomal protein L11 methyltransferase